MVISALNMRLPDEIGAWHGRLAKILVARVTHRACSCNGTRRIHHAAAWLKIYERTPGYLAAADSCLLLSDAQLPPSRQIDVRADERQIRSAEGPRVRSCTHRFDGDCVEAFLTACQIGNAVVEINPAPPVFPVKAAERCSEFQGLPVRASVIVQ